MPKRGLFRNDQSYNHIDSTLAGRAFSALYALHGVLVKKEEKSKRIKRDRWWADYRSSRAAQRNLDP